jgi:hypothetical protein
MLSMETTRESRPNTVTNQGIPAAGTNIPPRTVVSTMRSASVSSTACRQIAGSVG